MADDLNAIYTDIKDLSERHLAASFNAQDRLFKAMNGSVTYGELRSFEIARHHGVSAEQFAALPTREARMKWLIERRSRGGITT